MPLTVKHSTTLPCKMGAAMSNDHKNPRYSVGYGRPPKDTQFKPGQSGNRKGRPRGSKNFDTLWEAELKSLIPITEKGKRKVISKIEAIIKQLVTKAAAGDLRALLMFLNEFRRHEGLKARSTNQDLPLSSAAVPMDIQEAERAYQEAVKNAKSIS